MPTIYLSSPTEYWNEDWRAVDAIAALSPGQSLTIIFGDHGCAVVSRDEAGRLEWHGDELPPVVADHLAGERLASTQARPFKKTRIDPNLAERTRA